MANEVLLADGVAQRMGDGVFVLCQRDEKGAAHSVVVTAEDLRRLLGQE